MSQRDPRNINIADSPLVKTKGDSGINLYLTPHPFIFIIFIKNQRPVPEKGVMLDFGKALKQNHNIYFALFLWRLEIILHVCTSLTG